MKRNEKAGNREAQMQRLLESLNAWVIDHWYGRLSLGESFWINCFFVNLGAGIVLRRFTLASGGLMLLGIASLMISLWQLVGLWRSAQRNKDQQLFWSTVVRVLCVLNVAAFILITIVTLFSDVGIFANMPLGSAPEPPSQLSPNEPSGGLSPNPTPNVFREDAV